jgi:hypothetical protein
MYQCTRSAVSRFQVPQLRQISFHTKYKRTHSAFQRALHSTYTHNTTKILVQLTANRKIDLLPCNRNCTNKCQDDISLSPNLARSRSTSSSPIFHPSQGVTRIRLYIALCLRRNLVRIAAPDEAARWICSRDPRLNLCHRDDFLLRVRVGIVPALDARFCFPELREPSGSRGRRLASGSLSMGQQLFSPRGSLRERERVSHAGSSGEGSRKMGLYYLRTRSI